MICAFIPARSGSKRIKNKNIRLIAKKPLIFYTVRTALLSDKISKVIFSSDKKEYFDLLLKFLNKDKINIKNLEFDLRNKKYSTSKYKIFDYFKIFFNKYPDRTSFKIAVQLLPTSPLRTIKTLNSLINVSINSKKNVFSASEYNFPINFAFRIKKRNWQPIFPQSPMVTGVTRSQDQEKLFRPNGSIYCIWLKNLKSNQQTFYEQALPVIISKIESLDIDSPEDFKFCEFLLEKKIFKFD